MQGVCQPLAAAAVAAAVAAAADAADAAAAAVAAAAVAARQLVLLRRRHGALRETRRPGHQLPGGHARHLDRRVQRRGQSADQRLLEGRGVQGRRRGALPAPIGVRLRRPNPNFESSGWLTGCFTRSDREAGDGTPKYVWYSERIGIASQLFETCREICKAVCSPSPPPAPPPRTPPLTPTAHINVEKRGLILSEEITTTCMNHFSSAVSWTYDYSHRIQKAEQLAWHNDHNIEFVPMVFGFSVDSPATVGSDYTAASSRRPRRTTRAASSAMAPAS